MASCWPIPTGGYVAQVIESTELSLQGHGTGREGRETRLVRWTENNQLAPLTFSQEVTEESAPPDKRDKEGRGRCLMRKEENEHSRDVRGVARLMKKASPKMPVGKNPYSKLILEQEDHILKITETLPGSSENTRKEFCSFEEKFEGELVIRTK